MLQLTSLAELAHGPAPMPRTKKIRVRKKVPHKPRSPGLRERIIDALSYDDWVGTPEFAARLGHSPQAVRYVLSALVEDGLVYARTVKKLDSSGKLRDRNEYRKLRPGFVAPLYDSLQDAWELASCWNGFTFINQPGAI